MSDPSSQATSPTNLEQERLERERAQQRYNMLVAVFTGFLALTAGLQVWLLLIANGDGHKSADAAEKSAIAAESAAMTAYETLNDDKAASVQAESRMRTQLGLMSDQKDAMKKAAAASEKGAAASMANAQAAKSSAATANEALQKSKAFNESLLSQTKKSADAATSVAELTRVEMLLIQRPFMILDAAAQAPFTVNVYQEKSPGYFFTLVNRGATIARDNAYTVWFSLLNTKTGVKRDLGNWSGTGKDCLPGSSLMIGTNPGTARNPSEGVSSQDMSDLKNDIQRLEIKLQVKYTDDFRSKGRSPDHHTKLSFEGTGISKEGYIYTQKRIDPNWDGSD